MSLKDIKDILANVAGGRCEYCKSLAKYATESFCIDHILPKSKGGNDELTNLAYSCMGCNSRKYNKTEALDPVTGEKAPLFNPRNDNWNENFVWSADSLKILGISPMGRATIEALKLNRKSLMNLRKLLVASDEHP
ncbi:MAG: HNH endonuclease, partial [Okeania sp. SIO3C4]|nr:HNH endonuclease [Okeania sp. SIO3C4]